MTELISKKIVTNPLNFSSASSPFSVFIRNDNQNALRMIGGTSVVFGANFTVRPANATSYIVDKNLSINSSV